MPYLFFFSYARANSDDYLKKFFDDLSDRIRRQLGLDPKEPVGFFDQPHLELGEDWIEVLNSQVQECPVIVSLYSPAYFRSTYCGKEWECFRRRRELYVTQQKAAGNQDVQHPPVIKPVIWIPLMENQSPPEVVGGPQYYKGDPLDDENRVGLHTMRRLQSKFEDSYERSIENLKNEILEAQGFNLPSLVDFRGLDAIDSAFHPSNDEGEQPVPLPPGRNHGGPFYARFVFIAGEPDLFPEGARAREFYLQFGGPEWKPYYPEAPMPIMALAQNVASDLQIFTGKLDFAANLTEEVRKLESEGSLVVLFVDSWTAEMPTYEKVLKSFDESSFFNCSIFVPWNVKDPQTAGRREELRLIVRKIFRRSARLADLDQPIYFRDSIFSIDELRDQLRDTLRQLQSEVARGVIDRATKDTIPRRIDTDIARPVLSHKSP